MITTRRSPARQKNAEVVESRGSHPSNAAWAARRGAAGALLLIGGSGLIDFRIRVAQSHLRSDLLPSFWSTAGVLVSSTAFFTVPIDARLVPETVPSRNAIHECAISDFDDPVRYPNIAILNFANHPELVVPNVRSLQTQRSAIDLVQLLVPWLAFVWGAAVSGNPLLQNIGLPSAGMVETAYGISGIELTPGVSSAASCPEAIWQSALWWHDYYRDTADATAGGTRAGSPPVDQIVAIVPRGEYVVRQRAAAVVEPAETTRPGATPPKRSRRA